jgi:hypothetical protein
MRGKVGRGLTTSAPAELMTRPLGPSVSDDLPSQVPITHAELTTLLSFLGPEIGALLDSDNGKDGASERDGSSSKRRPLLKSKDGAP